MMSDVLAAESENQAPVEMARCVASGEWLPIQEMLPYGDAWVAAEHSDAFVEQVLEGGVARVASRYVSTRRRALALIIDYFVKLIPVSIVHAPYFIAATKFSEKVETTAPEDMAGLLTLGFVLAWLGAKVGNLLIGSIYETWMVGRYGATLGKLAVGARVVMPDGGRVGYARAALRWVAKSLLNGAIFWAVLGLPVALAFGLFAFAAARGGDVTALLPLMIWGIVAVGVVFFPLSLFPYWMAVSDSEKRSLHDRVASTRVVDAPETEEGKS